jgi:hypothetical protein
MKPGPLVSAVDSRPSRPGASAGGDVCHASVRLAVTDILLISSAGIPAARATFKLALAARRAANLDRSLSGHASLNASGLRAPGSRTLRTPGRWPCDVRPGATGPGPRPSRPQRCRIMVMRWGHGQAGWLPVRAAARGLRLGSARLASKPLRSGCQWEPTTDFGRGSSPLVYAAPISRSLAKMLGNLTDDRRKIERAAPGRKIPRTVAASRKALFIARFAPRAVRTYVVLRVRAALQAT